ncbi:MAG: zf-TFIIB domain-containing protein [Tepidiformaceae bacterium]
MKCPIDSTELSISDRQGVEIDFCPQCRGVWLDRGELDKILERSNGFGENERGRTDRRDDDDDDDQGGIRGFLGNLFDF